MSPKDEAWTAYDRAVANAAVARAYALDFPSPSANRAFLAAKARETMAAYRVMAAEAWQAAGSPSFLRASSPPTEPTNE